MGNWKLAECWTNFVFWYTSWHCIANVILCEARGTVAGVQLR